MTTAETELVFGGVTEGPNGEGCTEPHGSPESGMTIGEEGQITIDLNF